MRLIADFICRQIINNITGQCLQEWIDARVNIEQDFRRLFLAPFGSKKRQQKGRDT
jgi:hypothetical protein